MVGLANVDNTTDANKPVSTATQTALDLKEKLSKPNKKEFIKKLGLSKKNKTILCLGRVHEQQGRILG